MRTSAELSLCVPGFGVASPSRPPPRSRPSRSVVPYTANLKRLFRPESYESPRRAYVLSASSRSRTDFSSLMRIVVRLGRVSVGVLWAVTRAGYAGAVHVFGSGKGRRHVYVVSE